jgi:hypothetical protein
MDASWSEHRRKAKTTLHQGFGSLKKAAFPCRQLRMLAFWSGLRGNEIPIMRKALLMSGRISATLF